MQGPARRDRRVVASTIGRTLTVNASGSSTLAFAVRFPWLLEGQGRSNLERRRETKRDGLHDQDKQECPHQNEASPAKVKCRKVRHACSGLSAVPGQREGLPSMSTLRHLVSNASQRFQAHTPGAEPMSLDAAHHLARLEHVLD